MSMASKSKDATTRTIPEAAISAEVLHRHFEENEVFRECEYNPPNKKALHELADNLEALRGFVQSSPALVENHKRNLDFLRGIRFFHDYLPEVIAAHHNLEKYLDHAKIQREVRALKDLAIAVERVKEEIFPRYNWAPIDDAPTRKKKKPDTEWFAWQDHAWLLVSMFRTAMRPTNPDVDIKLSNYGPISRFLEVIFPLVTGESVVGVNVIRWLHRNPD
jgi:hypothetical protein